MRVGVLTGGGDCPGLNAHGFAAPRERKGQPAAGADRIRSGQTHSVRYPVPFIEPEYR